MDEHDYKAMNEELNHSSLLVSYIINRATWCKVFDKMNDSPEIDMKGMRDCDRLAVLSWLINNYHAPKKLKNSKIQKSKNIWRCICKFFICRQLSERRQSRNEI